jgi:hypothetical protein
MEGAIANFLGQFTAVSVRFPPITAERASDLDLQVVGPRWVAKPPYSLPSKKNTNHLKSQRPTGLCSDWIGFRAVASANGKAASRSFCGKMKMWKSVSHQCAKSLHEMGKVLHIPRGFVEFMDIGDIN